MFYNLVLYILYTMICIFSFFNHKLKSFLRKRTFEIKSIEKGNYILLHASSFGEINLLEPFIKKIIEKTDKKIIISVVTDTGYNQAVSKYLSERIKVVYFPLDIKRLIKKLFKNVCLEKVIIVETEIWPNLIKYSAENSRLYLLNGRISDKSYSKYKMLKYYLKNILSDFERLIMQSEDDKNRIIELGAPKEKVFNYGNLKFDISFEDYTELEKNNYKDILGLHKKVFVAGSTRDGEEKIILDTFKRLTDYQLVIVPRHLERIEEIKAELGAYKYCLYSDVKKDSEVILVDKMGVLRKLYSIADVAFVGGTLVNIGGHSLLEPLYYGKKPIFGPYIQNVRDIASEILKLNLGYKVENAEELLGGILDYVNSIEDKEKIKDFIDKNSKSSEKSFKLIFQK